VKFIIISAHNRSTSNNIRFGGTSIISSEAPIMIRFPLTARRPNTAPIAFPLYAMKILAQDVRAVIVPNSGHWIPEEQPQFVIRQLANFFADSNTTKTSK